MTAKTQNLDVPDLAQCQALAKWWPQDWQEGQGYGFFWVKVQSDPDRWNLCLKHRLTDSVDGWAAHVAAPTIATMVDYVAKQGWQYGMDNRLGVASAGVWGPTIRGDWSRWQSALKPVNALAGALKAAMKARKGNA